jgi:HPr kinase/phosphorylase
MTIVTPGTLVSVLGCGVLLQGMAGIGKSELALGLVDRGHQLVADDGPEFSVTPSGVIMGSAPAGFAGFIEVRGIGVLNLVRIYSVAATQASVQLGLILKMEQMNCVEYDRIQGRYGVEKMCGQEVPWRGLPVSAGRNLPLLVETLVRVQQMSDQGYDAGEEFLARVNATMQQGAA